MSVFLGSITKIDFYILNYLQQILSCGTLDFLMPLISFLGNAGIIWILSGLCLISIKKYRYWGIVLLLGIAAGALIGNVIMKPVIARPRPCWSEIPLALLIKNPHDFSFPSGHTLSSVIAAVILTKADRRFGYVAVPLAFLIAFSRLYLYVHFPTDVVAGAVIGVIIGFGTLMTAERYIHNKVQSQTLINKLTHIN